MTLPTTPALAIESSNLETIKKTDYSRLERQQTIELKLTKQKGLEHRKYCIKVSENRIVLEGFHKKNASRADCTLYIGSENPMTSILFEALAAPFMPPSVVRKQLETLPVEHQKQIIKNVPKPKAMKVLKSMLEDNKLSALEMLQMFPFDACCAMVSEVNHQQLNRLLSAYIRTNNHQLEQVLPYFPNMVCVPFINQLSDAELQNYFIKLTLASEDKLNSRSKIHVRKHLNHLTSEKRLSLFCSCSPSVAMELIKYLSANNKKATITQLPPENVARVLVCCLHLDTSLRVSIEGEQSPWWIQECAHLIYSDRVELKPTEKTRPPINGQRTSYGDFNEFITLLNNHDKKQLTSVYHCFTTEELALLIQLEEHPATHCLTEVQLPTHPQYTQLRNAYPVIKSLYEFGQHREVFYFAEECTPQKVLMRLSQLSGKSLHTLLDEPQVELLFTQYLVPAVMQNENSDALINDLIMLMQDSEIELQGYLFHYIIDSLPDEALTKLNNKSIINGLTFSFIALTPVEQQLPQILKLFPILPAECKTKLCVFWHSKMPPITQEQLTSLSSEHLNIWFEIFKCLDRQQQLQTIRNLPNDTWLKTAQKIPVEQLHLWIDFDSELQTRYWLSRPNRLSISELMYTLSPQHKRTLFHNIPIPDLIDAISHLPVEVRIEVFTFAEFHPKVPLLIEEWEKIDQSSLMETLKFSEDPENASKLLQSKSYEALAFSLASTNSKSRANIIPRYFRKYQLRRNAKFEEKRSSVVIMTNPRHKLAYWHTKDSIIPPLRKPDGATEQTPARNTLKGASKTAQSFDESFIKFKVTEISKNGQTTMVNPWEVEENQRILGALIGDAKKMHRELPTISPGLQGQYITHVPDGTIVPYSTLIAARGGLSLTAVTKPKNSQPTKVNVHCFQQLCADIATSHQLGYFYRDIKPDNILYAEYADSQMRVRHHRPQLHQIDLSTLCWAPVTGDPEQSHKKSFPLEEATGTPSHFTQGIIVSKTEADRQGLQMADNYALLLTILESVSIDFNRIEKVPSSFDSKVDPGYAKQRAKGDVSDAFEFGILHETSSPPRNRDIIEAAVEKYVLAEHQEAVKAFLIDPVRFPLVEALVDIMDWEVDDREFLE
ncbi:hypothetical protein D5018_15910 [Parashewanella curva]|uniref:Uncharacterized protein n=1 Tax=Parashewanella curva TaxID=2338552 RepID=A0A3L8PXA8_9GAMM|nr:hypothetical protein [Parashewanella curva]RLV58702.1 hypothetical protein D5018_15910 [Parashewanella curva]